MSRKDLYRRVRRAQRTRMWVEIASGSRYRILQHVEVARSAIGGGVFAPYVTPRRYGLSCATQPGSRLIVVEDRPCQPATELRRKIAERCV